MRRIKITACVLVSLMLISTAAVAFAQQVGNVDVDFGATSQVVSNADDSFIQTLVRAANSASPLVFTGDSDVTVELKDGKITGTPTVPVPKVIGSSTSPAIALTNATVFNLLFNTQQKISNNYTFVNSVPNSLIVNVPIYVEDSFKTAPSGYDSATNKLTLNDLRENFRKGNFQDLTKNTNYGYAIQYYYRDKNGDITECDRNSISWVLAVSMKARYTVDIAPLNIGGTPTLGGSLKNDTLTDYLGKNYVLGKISNLGGANLDGTRLYGSIGDEYSFDAGEASGYYVDYVTVKIYDPATGESLGTTTYKGKDAVNKALAAVNTVNGKTEIRVAYATDDPYIKKDANPSSGNKVKVGDTIVYTLTVRNTRDEYTNVTVKDPLPSQVTPVSYTVDGKAQSGNWNGSWTGTLPPRNSDGTASKVVIVITTKVNALFDNAAGADNIINNKATLTYTVQNKPKTEESEETVHYLVPTPSYTLTKERVTIPTGGGFAPDGDTEILYTATLTNTGDVPLSISLTDVFAQPSYFEFIGSSSSTVQLPVDNPNTSANEGVVKVVFKAKTTTNAQVGNHLNTVTATSGYTYTDPSTNRTVTVTGAALGDPLYKTATALTPVVAPHPDLAIGKTVNGASSVQVVPGAKLTYVVTISNIGNVRLTNIVITDMQSSIIENTTIGKLTSATTAMGKPVTISNLVISALDAGDSVTLVYTAKCSSSALSGAIGNNVVKATATYGSTVLNPEAEATIKVIHVTPGGSTLPQTGDDTDFNGMYIGMGVGVFLTVASLIASRKMCADRAPWRRKRR